MTKQTFRLYRTLLICCIVSALFSECTRRISKPIGSTSTTSNISSTEYISKVPNIIKEARTYMGTPHVFAGTDKSGLDCSGLVFVSFASVGIKFPRPTSEQSLIGKEIDIKSVKKGDLLFFNTGGSSKINHVGIVTELKGKENLRFIHTSTSRGVVEENFYAQYWLDSFNRAMRPF